MEQPKILSFPGPDQAKTGLGLGNIFKNIFGSGRVGFIRFRYGPGRGIFYRGINYFFPTISGINLESNRNHTLHPQTEKVLWLLSLISMYMSFQSIYSHNRSVVQINVVWKWLHFGLMIKCFDPVQSGKYIIRLVRGRGHKIYYFQVWFGLGQKIQGTTCMGLVCQKPCSAGLYLRVHPILNLCMQ